MVTSHRALILTLLFVFFCVDSPAWAETDAVFKAIDAFIAEEEIDQDDVSWRQTLDRPPQLEFDKEKKYYWVLKTNKGEMKFELHPDIAPMHVSSLIYLSRLGFYDELIFHRIIKRFMAQGGDPLGTGTGNAGYQLDGEFTKRRKGKHTRAGVLSSANRGPGTDGSQFFITFKEVSQLDGKHTVYGILVDGKQVLRAIENTGTRQGEPKELVEIVSASVVVE